MRHIPIIRIGNDINVSWKVYTRSGNPFSLLTKGVSLWLISGPVKIGIGSYQIIDTNEVSFQIDADSLHRYGIYKIVLRVKDEQANTDDATYDLVNLFEIVSRTYEKERVLEGTVDLEFESVINVLTDGLSAYEIAVQHGFEGTEEEWLASLKGEKGQDGQDGQDGQPGAPGAPGTPGVGVPAGGSAGQVLAKSSGSDYATEWVNQSGGGGTQVQSDWNQANTEAVDFIKNKPTIPDPISGLDDIPGVSISSPSNNQVLLYNGTNWVNATSPGGGGTMNYQKVTSEEYEEMLENDELLDTVLYVIVDPAAIA